MAFTCPNTLSLFSTMDSGHLSKHHHMDQTCHPHLTPLDQRHKATDEALQTEVYTLQSLEDASNHPHPLFLLRDLDIDARVALCRVNGGGKVCCLWSLLCSWSSQETFLGLGEPFFTSKNTTWECYWWAWKETSDQVCEINSLSVKCCSWTLKQIDQKKTFNLTFIILSINLLIKTESYRRSWFLWLELSFFGLKTRGEWPQFKQGGEPYNKDPWLDPNPEYCGYNDIHLIAQCLRRFMPFNN